LIQTCGRYQSEGRERKFAALSLSATTFPLNPST
jgi:hypothetical protein